MNRLTEDQREQEKAQELAALDVEGDPLGDWLAEVARSETPDELAEFGADSYGALMGWLSRLYEDRDDVEKTRRASVRAAQCLLAYAIEERGSRTTAQEVLATVGISIIEIDPCGEGIKDHLFAACEVINAVGDTGKNGLDDHNAEQRLSVAVACLWLFWRGQVARMGDSPKPKTAEESFVDWCKEAAVLGFSENEPRMCDLNSETLWILSALSKCSRGNVEERKRLCKSLAGLLIYECESSLSVLESRSWEKWLEIPTRTRLIRMARKVLDSACSAHSDTPDEYEKAWITALAYIYRYANQDA